LEAQLEEADGGIVDFEAQIEKMEESHRGGHPSGKGVVTER
jgi:hypothetical protein